MRGDLARNNCCGLALWRGGALATSVRVGTQIAQGVLRTSEGSFAVDDPVMAKQLPEPGGEDLGLREELEVAMEAELALSEGALQRGHKLAAKQFSS